MHCLVDTESNNNPNAVSPKGATGRFQVTGPAIRELQLQGLLGPTGSFTPDQAGLLNLEFLLTYCDSTVNAIAAYNAGYPTVNGAGGIPNLRETKNYVKKIDSCMKKMGHSGGL